MWSGAWAALRFFCAIAESPFAIVDMTNGEMGSRGTPEERKIEADAAADNLGAVARENLNLPDCGLVDSPENRRLIASAIRRHRPKIVLAPLWEDRHPDHAAAGLMVQNSRLFLRAEDSRRSESAPQARRVPVLPDPQIPPADFHRRYLTGVRAQTGTAADLSFPVRSASSDDYLFGLESRDRYYGSLIGVRHGEALVSDQPIRLGGPGDLLSLLK